jgi:hypothetical protein
MTTQEALAIIKARIIALRIDMPPDADLWPLAELLALRHRNGQGQTKH